MDYFSKPGLSFHKLKDYADYGPGYFYRKYISGEITTPDRDSFRMGRLIHMAVLEPDLFAQVQAVPAEYLTPTGLISTKKEAREWMKTVQGRDYGTPVELETATTLAAAVRRNREAREILESAIAVEQESHPDAKRDGVQIKGKADILTRVEVWDLKTINNLADIRDHCRDFHYAEQVCWYADLFGKEDGGIIFVEKSIPNRVQVVRFDEHVLSHARNQVDLWWGDYLDSLQANDWPNDPPAVVLTLEDLAA